MNTDTSNLNPRVGGILTAFANLLPCGDFIPMKTETPIADHLMTQDRIEALQAELDEANATIHRLAHSLSAARHANSGLSELIGHQRERIRGNESHISSMRAAHAETLRRLDEANMAMSKRGTRTEVAEFGEEVYLVMP